MTGIAEGRLSRRATWLILIAALAVTTGIMIATWPLGPDYYYTYQQVSRRWLRGETRLYDAQSRGFYNAPWAMALTVPLSLLPPRAGNGLLNAVSLLSMLAALYLLGESESVPIYALILPLANPHTFDLLIRGQIDTFILLGVALGWFAINKRQPVTLSVALWLMSMKPQNVVLVIGLFLWAIRRWAVTDWLTVLSLPLLSSLAFGSLIGFDWPFRYWTNLQDHPPLSYLRTTVWRGASQLNVPTWPLVVVLLALIAVFVNSVRNEGFNRQTLSIALATNLLFSPYALGYHYVLLVPAAFHVALDDWRKALASYLVTWSPLLRLRFGFDVAWIDAAYPAILLTALWFPFLRSLVSREAPSAIGI